MRAEPAPAIVSERQLAALAVALGARTVAGWSSAEESLTRGLPAPDAAGLARVARAIAAGRDPLGDLFCALRSPLERRSRGAVYTPAHLVASMLAWASRHGAPTQVIDPGVGSARFLVQAGRRFGKAELMGVELDPLAALLARAHLAAAGLASRAVVTLGDYRDHVPPRPKGRTLYVGNPPYVRHHLIEDRWKRWLVEVAERHHVAASQLAGLHAYFFLKTADCARPGDFGVFVTAAEWLDVNYGRLLRELVLGRLGGQSIHVVEATAAPFPDTATTAAITCFEIGSTPASIRFRRVGESRALGTLEGGRVVRRERLVEAGRWTPFLRPPRRAPEGYVELGELCRVHRGQVTGANQVWIAGPHAAPLPDCVLYPSVTKARELFSAGASLTDAASLRRVIDLPVDLDRFPASERRGIERFLGWARRRGAHLGYIARNRKAWWSVGLREPAPLLATYMARRPPTFVRNLVGARHINIAHGI
ncbi:MAG TPA: N-6 DNA methylase, partial [Methylomirabilota bacterium]|nr:N-6 DNA methylase [Methylomirabilota bacterium]